MCTMAREREGKGDRRTDRQTETGFMVYHKTEYAADTSINNPLRFSKSGFQKKKTWPRTFWLHI